jgi:death-on-curing protein
MIEYLSLEQVLELHAETIRRHGGRPGVRDLGLIESAVAQPQMTFGGQEL